MSALSIYALICRNLLELNSLDDPNSELWEETVRKLRRLRHVVQCRVCKAIPKDPYGASGCNHVTCGDCKDTKKSQFSGCRFCKNTALFELDKQTKVVLKCYAKVCEILQSYHNSAGKSRRTDRIEKIWDLVSEGVRLFQKQDTGIGFMEETCNDRSSYRLPSPVTTIDKQIRESDVDYVLYENKFVQDGGSFQDGTFMQDGARGLCILQGNSENGTDGLNEKIHSEKHHGSVFDFDVGKGLGVEVNGHFSSKNETGKAAYAGKEKQSENFELNSHSLNDNFSPEVEPMNKEHQNDREKTLGEAINGYSFKKQFNNTAHNGIPPRKHGKRKFSPFKSSSGERTPSKLREGNIIKGDANLESQNQKCPKTDEMTGQEANGKLHGKNNHHRKTPKLYHRNENRSVNKQKGIFFQDGDEISDKKGRNSIGHRQYNFVRKNKYKCTCGSASGLKHFTDICNHRRCVCYAAGVPCVSCKCRFCSNPHKSNYNLKWSPVGMERDMQPVKMEQTAEDGV